MKAILALCLSTATELRRDKIFLPLLIASVCLLIGTHLVSSLSIEDYDKLFFDLASLILELFGGVSALVWGSGLLGLSRSDAAWEVQLVAPISRSGWVLGRFLGLATSLLCLGLLLALTVHVTMGLLGLAWFKNVTWWFFIAHTLGWFVLAALAVFFASFCGKETALFAAFSCWVAGLTSRLAAAHLPADTDPISRWLIKGVAWLWDLRRFTADPLLALTSGLQPTSTAVAGGILYAASLVALLLLAAAVVINSRDLSH